MASNDKPQKVFGAGNHSVLSMVSKNYDVGDKGFLTDTEQQMRGMDSGNVGHLTNAKVSAIVNETLGLREKNGTMKMWLGILGAAVAVLGLSNLGSAFAAAWLAKDTTINESTGQLLVKDTDSPVTTQSTGLTSNLVLEESNSYGCMDRDDAAKLWAGVLAGTPSSLTVQDPSQQNADVDLTLQAFSALALTTNGATWNETMACMPVSDGSGDKVCVDFTDNRCDGADHSTGSRALKVIDHHTRRKLFHEAGQGHRDLSHVDNIGLIVVTIPREGGVIGADGLLQSDLGVNAGPDLGSLSPPLSPSDTYYALGVVVLKGTLYLDARNNTASGWTFTFPAALTTAAESKIVFVNEHGDSDGNDVDGNKITPDCEYCPDYEENAAKLKWFVTGTINLGASSYIGGGMKSGAAITLGASSKAGNLCSRAAINLGASASSGSLTSNAAVTVGASSKVTGAIRADAAITLGASSAVRSLVTTQGITVGAGVTCPTDVGWNVLCKDNTGESLDPVFDCMLTM
jgi:hypothetical protein